MTGLKIYDKKSLNIGNGKSRTTAILTKYNGEMVVVIERFRVIPKHVHPANVERKIRDFWFGTLYAEEMSFRVSSLLEISVLCANGTTHKFFQP